MAGAIIVFLAMQMTESERPFRPISGKYESLVPFGLRRDPERLLREAQRGGGGRETEDAVLSALRWLSRVQNPDGSWDVPDERLRVQVTALAVLAFLGNRFMPCSPDRCSVPRGYGNRFASTAPDSSGHPERTSREASASFHLTVRRGLRWLIRSQDPDGFIGTRGHYGALSGHCVATTALSEAYGWSNLLVLRGPAERAIGALMASRSDDGTWRGEIRKEDWVVNGWVAMALGSAAISEIPFSRSIYEDLRAWRREERRSGAPAVPWAADAYVGWHLSRVLQSGEQASRPVLTGDQLAHELSSLTGEGPDFNRWYWATAALFYYDGPNGTIWKQWNGAMVRAIVGSQDSTPSARRGSWAPVHPGFTLGGRVHVTALNVLSLSVYHSGVNVFGLR